MGKVIFGGLITEGGYTAELTVEEIYEELTSEHCRDLAVMLTWDGYMERPEIKELVNEDFNDKLDALKTVYYRLSSEEEDMLNNLFKKYL